MTDEDRTNDGESPDRRQDVATENRDTPDEPSRKVEDSVDLDSDELDEVEE